MAIMALLPDTEIDRLLADYAADYKRAKLTPAQIVQGIAATRKLGYARSTNEVTPNIGSVGVAFRIDTDTLASIAVGTSLNRLTPPRCEKIGALIHRELQAALSRSKAGTDAPA
jgi:DNA-binding IclR family transcriptional regulator